jgi:hypothetical protein
MPSAMVLATAYDAPTVANIECNCRARARYVKVLASWSAPTG